MQDPRHHPPKTSLSPTPHDDASMGQSEPITDLLISVREGDQDSLDRLFELVYDDLKRRAHHQLVGSTPTLNTTAPREPCGRS